MVRRYTALASPCASVRWFSPHSAIGPTNEKPRGVSSPLRLQSHEVHVCPSGGHAHTAWDRFVTFQSPPLRGVGETRRPTMVDAVTREMWDARGFREGEASPRNNNTSDIEMPISHLGGYGVQSDRRPIGNGMIDYDKLRPNASKMGFCVPFWERHHTPMWAIPRRNTKTTPSKVIPRFF